ncbi:putative holin, partial [Klebsiella pneumoniae]|nr:putative holin [Klebsiella pneumoniae]
LGAVIVSAITIKVLTFLNNQEMSGLIGMLSRMRGGGSSGK